jgi:hypothetical protein
MAVPEAPMHKDDALPRWEDQIRFPGEVSLVQSEAESLTVE